MRSAVMLDGTAGTDGLTQRSVLPSGVRIITERVPAVRSVAFGIWVDVGSRDETPAYAGASHFLEHLLFKGTRHRDALAIAAEIDSVGGEANAWTGKEQTCFYTRVLDTDLALAVDVTVDMLSQSLLTPADVESERRVVLDEIAMHEDDPSDVAHDDFSALVFGGSPLALPILGTEESMTAMTRQRVHQWWRRRYVPPAMVVTAAGSLEHEHVVELVAAAFGGQPDATPSGLRPGAGRAERRAVQSERVRVTRRPTEQTSLVLGGIGPSRRDPDSFVFAVLMNALGGGPSSRLFQQVREKRGLTYSIYSFGSGFSDSGLWAVASSSAPRHVREIVTITRGELSALAADGITAEELRRAQGQLRGGLLLGLEDTSARMDRLGKAELAYGELLSVEQLLERIDSVTEEQVAGMAARVFAQPLSLAAVGPRGDGAAYEKLVA